MRLNLLALGIGLVVGLLNGLLAVGGTILVPALVHLLGHDQREAQAGSLWVILPTSAMSLGVYASRHALTWDLALLVGAGGVAGSVVGARLLHVVPRLWLKRLFAAFLLVAAYRMAVAP